MRIWKNGKESPYMHGDEKLTTGQIQHAVMSMNYSGLHVAAACFLVIAQNNGFTPAQMIGILEAEDKKPNVTVHGGNIPFTFAALREGDKQ